MWLILLACFMGAWSVGYQTVWTLPLGDNSIPFVRWSLKNDDSPGFSFLNLHQNENASVVAAKAFAFSQSNLNIYYLNKTLTKNGLATRNVFFTMGGTEYQFDPNRMFTPVGIPIQFSYLLTFSSRDQSNSYSIQFCCWCSSPQFW